MADGQLCELLDVVKVSPFIVANHELADFLLITLILSSLVVCEDFEHKISTATSGEPLLRGSLGSTHVTFFTIERDEVRAPGSEGRDQRQSQSGPLFRIAE